MAANLSRLLAAGFRPAGKWSLVNQVLQITLDLSAAHDQNVLYAFAVDGRLVYIGKTTQSLRKRMQGYKSPASNAARGGSTNIKNNRNIIDALLSGATVDIYVLNSLPTHQHGQFNVNLSAGLEDSLIGALVPPWNGRSEIAANSSAVPRGDARHLVAQSSAKVSSGTAIRTALLKERRAMGNGVQPMNSIFPSTESLFSFCKRVKGETMTTAIQKTSFRVEVVGNNLEITPGSSKEPRRESKANVTLILARLAKTMSCQTSDYQDVSFNVSYVLALVKAWQDEFRAQ